MYIMPYPLRSTNNSLFARHVWEEAPLSSTAPTGATAVPSSSVVPLYTEAIVEAVANTLGSTLPTIISSTQGNAPLPL